ncbi:uncharacterized protein [Typha latifolia]|uniref:uncharacterized protein n=1 Tax=Typha latifolia TaxID=4733 RepID=UPI003C2F352D
MGKEVDVEVGGGEGSLESRPGVIFVGSRNVGKRTILSRLISIDIPDTPDLSSGVLCQGWTIETKYYSADLSIWTAHIDEGFSIGLLPTSKQLAGLVMVFDMSDESSFHALQKWVSNTDIAKFEILLCIGNKADLVTGHYAHAEYRRHMQKLGESTSDPHPEYLDFGIDETEACNLLGEEEPSAETRKSTLEWCIQNNIEYIEACASNADFDKCLSIDGDIQGVERLLGALSAHMWPGMILKSGNRITNPSIVEKEQSSDDESDYEVEYEVLSHGSDEPWYGAGESSMISMEEGFLKEVNQDQGHEISNSDVASGASSSLSNVISSEAGTVENADAGRMATEDKDQECDGSAHADQTPTPETEAREEIGINVTNTNELDEDLHYGLDDLERLMSEIGNMRSNLRLMPDFQRREMAANLAMKMAAMFGDTSDEDGL